MRHFVKCAVAALGVFAATGAVQAQNWNEIVERAKKEGEVVVYSNLVGDPTLKAVVAQFTKIYGIKVNVLEGRATEIRERTRTEQAAGRFLGDVTFTTSGQGELIARGDKSYVPHAPTPNVAQLRAPFKHDGLFAPVMTIAYGILINTNLVKPEDEPRNWADLANPRWKGKILSDDTRAIGGGYLMFFATLNAPALGRKFHEQLASNAPVFNRAMRDNTRRIGRGEFPIYMPFIYTDIANLKGLPVKYIIPGEGSPYVIYGHVVNRNAPHPNAALVYIDYWMSEEVQMMWARTGMGITRDGLADKIPQDVRAMANAPLLGTTDINRQNEGLALAKEIYK